MNVDRSPMWIGLADLLLCILSVVIVAVAPTKATVDDIKPNAEFLITADWPIALNSDVDLWLGRAGEEARLYGSRDAGCVSLDRDTLGFSTSQITLGDTSQAVIRHIARKFVRRLHRSLGVLRKTRQRPSTSKVYRDRGSTALDPNPRRVAARPPVTGRWFHPPGSTRRTREAERRRRR
jgi:hypothetical protein